ncbi:MAG TPA: hypothetical protein VHD61_15745 [Lacunisphaera sp.]|nr:hypothetical protein [Lacunisphaera sp.]
MDTPYLSSGYHHERECAFVDKDWPFANRPVPDVDTVTYLRKFSVRRARYAPKIANRNTSTPPYSVPDLDPDDNQAYLVEESKPAWKDDIFGIVSRLFSRIPGDQVEPGSTPFSRPALHDVYGSWNSGKVYAVSFDNLLTSWLFFARTATSGALGNIQPGTVVGVAAESFGTLPNHICYIADTTYSTSFFLDGTPSSIQAALAGVLGALTSIQVSGVAGAITLTWVGTVKYLYSTSSAVTLSGGAGLNGSATFTASRPTVSDTQTVTAPTRTIATAAGHGGSDGQWMAAWNGDKLVGMIKPLLASGSSITIAVDEGPWNVADLVITHVAFAPAGLRLVNGTRDCSIRTTERYYLPGVTAGISSAADIPSIPLYTDPLGWLSRILAGVLTAVATVASNDRLGKTAHGLATGDSFFVVSQGGASGLSILTQYFAIKVDADHFQAATSSENAAAGTAVNLTADRSDLVLLVPANYAAVAVTNLKSWHGPILMKSFDEVQLADAVETRDPSQ